MTFPDSVGEPVPLSIDVQRPVCQHFAGPLLFVSGVLGLRVDLGRRIGQLVSVGNDPDGAGYILRLVLAGAVPFRGCTIILVVPTAPDVEVGAEAVLEGLMVVLSPQGPGQLSLSFEVADVVPVPPGLPA